MRISQYLSLSKINSGAYQGDQVVLVIEWRKLGDLIPIIDEAQDNTTNLRSPVDIIPAALCRPNTTDGMGKIHGSVAGIAVVTCQ